MKKNKIFSFFIAITILGIFLYIPNIYKSYETLKNLKKELSSEIERAKNLTETMNSLNFQVENSDELYYVEEFVRNNLDMKKKNEIIYRVIYEEEER